MLAELIQAGDETLQSEIRYSICNKKELPDQWKVSNIVPVYKKNNESDSSNYCGTPLLSDILSRLSPYIDEVMGEHLCGF
jgi:hypothetical protein